MSELNDQVTRNIKVLMAVRGVDGYSPLARILDIHPDSVSNKMRGKRQWSIGDIEKLAKEFRIPAPSIIGDGRDLLDPPSGLGRTGTTGGPSTTVRRDGFGLVIPFPQVEADTAVLHTLADVIPLTRARMNHPARPSRDVAV